MVVRVNKRRDSKFSVGSRKKPCKRCEYNSKNEDNSLKTLNANGSVWIVNWFQDSFLIFIIRLHTVKWFQI